MGVVVLELPFWGCFEQCVAGFVLLLFLVVYSRIGWLICGFCWISVLD